MVWMKWYSESAEKAEVAKVIDRKQVVGEIPTCDRRREEGGWRRCEDCRVLIFFSKSHFLCINHLVLTPIDWFFDFLIRRVW